jgi:hypothetical protein
MASPATHVAIGALVLLLDYRRIPQHIAAIFGIDIDKDVVRRVLATHYRPKVIAQDGFRLGAHSYLLLHSQAAELGPCAVV